MGFLKKLLGVGVTAGATVAAVKIADKYKANNPNGVPDANGDGKVDAADVIAGVKKAAGEVYGETKVKMGDAVNSAKEKAPDVYEKAKQTVTETVKNAPETYEKVKAAAKEKIDDLQQDIRDAKKDD